MGEPADILAPRGGRAERLASRTILVWAGLSIGVGLAGEAGAWTRSDAAPEVLRLYSLAQLAGLVLLAALVLGSPGRRRWLARLSPPALVVAAQALWLTPQPLGGVAAPGRDALPPTSAYLALEAVKLVWLLAVGFGPDLVPRSARPARAHRSSWIPIAPARPLSERSRPICARR
jgi:hypothetical protein